MEGLSFFGETDLFLSLPDKVSFGFFLGRFLAGSFSDVVFWAACLLFPGVLSFFASGFVF